MNTPIRLVSTPEIGRAAGIAGVTALRRLQQAGISPDAVIYFGRGNLPAYRADRITELLEAVNHPTPAFAEPVPQDLEAR